MALPFTVDQFLDVFVQMNRAIWPAQIGAYALGAAVLAAALRGGGRAGRAIPALLAGAWAFMGIVYPLVFFTRINPAAWLFGAAFLVEAVLLVDAAARRRLAFGGASPARAVLGVALVAYAAVVYPLLGIAWGRVWPRGPMFGVAPCPTVIFTFGILLLARGAVPARLLVVPFLWALLGASAASSLGVREDLGLLAAGVLATGTLLLARRPRPDPLQARRTRTAPTRQRTEK